MGKGRGGKLRCLFVSSRSQPTKMGLRGRTRTGFFLTVCLLWVTGCLTQKVYFDCGARVDVMDVQGLILSPGFPYNYSSGTHCVWQFFVPSGHQLIMEMFDFDVFESPNSPVRDTTPSAAFMEDAANSRETLVSKSLGSLKEPQSLYREEVKQVVIQEQSTKMEITKVSNSANIMSDRNPQEHPVEDRVSVSSQSSRIAREFVSTSPSTETDEDVSSETQPAMMDACPHDVLYISDLITFSSRFCGSKRPSSSQLVFGSDDDMVEVIMELITTTHWGRGFALLFHYENQTNSPPTEQQRSILTSDSRTSALLGAVSGTVAFAVALAGVLCVIFRPKLCPKGTNASSSTSSEVPEGVLNSAADVSELQMVSPNISEQQPSTENDNYSLSRAGSSVTGVGEGSEKTALEIFSSGLTEVELGTDEVFVIASVPNSAPMPFSPHTQRERFLRHSDTGTNRPFDWSATDPSLASVMKNSTGSTNNARPRAWSVRTFQDLLPPLPQLHKRWCSWNSTSPFTKLVDSGLSSGAPESRRGKLLSEAPQSSPVDSAPSDSFMSNASYPLSQPAQRQRRLNSTSNLRRALFNTPCFGLLSGTSECPKSQANAIPAPHSPSDSPLHQQKQLLQSKASSHEDEHHLTVPVFAISEEEDHQPLVSAEHPEMPPKVNGHMFEGTDIPLLSKSPVTSVQPSPSAKATQQPSALSG